VMAMYKKDTCHHGTFIPFVRWNRFLGGHKAERNAPFADISEYEIGNEWQINKSTELTLMYTWTDRTNTTAFSDAGVRSYRQFEGQLLRCQFQINY
jgi:hypothetical protein